MRHLGSNKTKLYKVNKIIQLIKTIPIINQIFQIKQIHHKFNCLFQTLLFNNKFKTTHLMNLLIILKISTNQFKLIAKIFLKLIPCRIRHNNKISQ